MKRKLFSLLCLAFTLNLFSQTNLNTNSSVKRYYYRDSVVSMERWLNNKKALDSIKTYYNSGELNEAFYYINNKLQGPSFKYNKKGDKTTTWTFENGRLTNRVDHIIEFNKKDKKKIKESLNRLRELNAKLRQNPRDFRSIYSRGHLRSYLGNNTLALRDFAYVRRVISKINKTKSPELFNKMLGSIYDVTASIYAKWEMKTFATHYRYKAFRADPENTRLVFNFGAYLYSIKSYRLSKIYLYKTLKKWPKHAFTHRVLAALYTDFENFDKALYHINLAFPKEEHLLKFGYGKVERDIRTLRGFILHKLGESENGIHDLKEAIRLSKDNSFAHRNLGAVYYDLGEYELACSYLSKAKDLGYEKIHDRDDLQAYLELSCEHAQALKKSESVMETIIESPKLTEKPFVYPNPTKSDFSIKNLSFKTFDYYVFDYSGRQVYQGSSTNTNISHLPIGVYILKVTNSEKTETFRIVKE